MTLPAEKLGLFLSEGLHQDMLTTAERLNTRKNPRKRAPPLRAGLP